MKNFCAGVLLVTMLAVVHPMRAAAQAPPPAPKPNTSMLVPLEMDVVISRFQGEKKISSQPYMLAVNATEDGSKGYNPLTASRLRIGTQVPLTTTVSSPGDGKTPPAPPVPTTIFRDVGTQIDCNARVLQDGRFDVTLTVAETTVAPTDKQIATANFPVLTQFSSTNDLLLRDGQTRQFVVATDRISGDVVKVEVTLKVVK